MAEKSMFSTISMCGERWGSGVNSNGRRYSGRQGRVPDRLCLPECLLPLTGSSGKTGEIIFCSGTKNCGRMKKSEKSGPLRAGVCTRLGRFSAGLRASADVTWRLPVGGTPRSATPCGSAWRSCAEMCVVASYLPGRGSVRYGVSRETLSELRAIGPRGIRSPCLPGNGGRRGPSCCRARRLCRVAGGFRCRRQRRTATGR